MGSDSSQPKQVPLPSANPIHLNANVVLQPPLSRRGKGPGILIFMPSGYKGRDTNDFKTLDPEPLQKWAEEGFATVQVKVESDYQGFEDACDKGVEALKFLPECTVGGKLAAIGI